MKPLTLLPALTVCALSCFASDADMTTGAASSVQVTALADGQTETAASTGSSIQAHAASGTSATAHARFENGQLRAGVVASPRDPLAHQAQARVSWSSRWKVTTADPSLPDGAFVTVNLGIHFSGRLTAGAWGGGYGNSQASGQVTMSSVRGRVGYSGTVALSSDADTGLPVPAANGAWQNAFQPAGEPLAFELHDDAILSLPAVVGQCLTLEASLETFAEALGWTPDPDGFLIPQPLWGYAAADLMDTARVEFLGGTDEQGNPVSLRFAPTLIPEPGCWAGCSAVCLLGWAYQRRRRKQG